MTGKIHSFESFGTVDGPGIRFVIFVQGCPMRCLYCHNPDTWQLGSGKEYTTEELSKMVLRYKSYFSNGGGVTISGGEPLLQMHFIKELFTLLKKQGIHTAIDTCGITFNPKDEANVKAHEELLALTDLFLLDLKHIDNEQHKILTKQSNEHALAFAQFLSDHGKDLWIRHVLVPDYTDNDEYLTKLSAFIKTLKTVKKIEVLPYHTMGKVKYERLGIEYPLGDMKPPTKERVINAKRILGVIHD